MRLKKKKKKDIRKQSKAVKSSKGCDQEFTALTFKISEMKQFFVITRAAT